MNSVRQFAESILHANTLEGKLIALPEGLSLDPPSRGSYSTPFLPGRPEDLRPRKAGDYRTKIPSAEQLSNDDHRSTLLHFFCNHELLAVELMALALLKFPDAPDAFRRGLLHTLQEEQEHARLYLNRMSATGTTFGEHSLSRMIWDLIAPMTSPIEYVSRLSLTFEQSNLDYAHHYSKAFENVGDTETSALLSQIYKDEIAHVGYGLKWLRRFKQEQQSDWDAWHESLAHPLTPVRAKAPEGIVPFNEEGRRKAGLTDDFIKSLQLYQRSRGRTPYVHLFNPNCERHLLADFMGTCYQSSKNERHLEEDLEALLFANTLPEDIALFRKKPSTEHLSVLRNAGLLLPEIVEIDSKMTGLEKRKLGGFRPWAWTPDSVDFFKPFAENPSANSQHPWRASLPAKQLSKSLTAEAYELLQLGDNNASHFFSKIKLAEDFIKNAQRPLLLKPPLACAGQGQFIITEDSCPNEVQKRLTHMTSVQGGVTIEPLLPRIFDYSALYDISRNGETQFLAFTGLETDSQGRYLGTRVAPKIGNIFPEELTIQFHQPCIQANGEMLSGPDFYKKVLPLYLSQLLPSYFGPVAIDAFFFQEKESLPQIRPIVEINARYSMGRIAHNLRRKLSPNIVGKLTIHRRQKLNGQLPTGLILNDPSQAQAFIATWNTES